MEIKLGTLWKGSFQSGVWIIIDLIDDFIYYAAWNQNGINFNSILISYLAMGGGPYNNPVKKITNREFIIEMINAMSKFEFLYKLSVAGRSI